MRASPCRPRAPVLIVAFGFHPLVGGTEVALLRVARELRSRGIPVLVLTRRLRGLPASDRVEGVPVRRLPFPTVAFLGPLLFNLALAWTLLRLLPRCRGAIASSVSHYVATAVVVGRVVGRPVVVRLQSSGAGADFPRARREPLGGVVARIVRGADRFLATTTTIRRELVEAGIPVDRIVLAPNGVDLEAVDRVATGRPRQGVVALGRLVWQKDLDRLLDAWGLLLRDADGLTETPTLEIYGEGPERARLAARIREEGLADTVFLRGFHDRPHEVLARARAFVSSSVVEGMANALLEAMAHGLAVVSTPVSGAADVIVDGDNGLLVDGEGPAPLAAQLRRVLVDDALTERLGRAARDTIAERYTAGSMADRYLEALASARAP